MEVAEIDLAETERILSAALRRPPCGENPDQVTDAELYLPLLVRRVGVLQALEWQPSGQSGTTSKAKAAQGALFADQAPALVESSPPSAPPATNRPGMLAKKKAPASRSRSSGPALQLEVILAGSKPPIWRRLVVPESITLERLHQVIQIAFGWTDSHLHGFEIGEAEYGPDGDWAEVRSERSRLNRLLAVGDRAAPLGHGIARFRCCRSGRVRSG